jgi:hypothetical protein
LRFSFSFFRHWAFAFAFGTGTGTGIGGDALGCREEDRERARELSEGGERREEKRVVGTRNSRAR